VQRLDTWNRPSVRILSILSILSISRPPWEGARSGNPVDTGSSDGSPPRWSAEASGTVQSSATFDRTGVRILSILSILSILRPPQRGRKIVTGGARVMRFWPKAPFPLLAKELAELAAQRRTYLLRALYAFLLFGVFLVATNQYFQDRRLNVAALGHGRDMLETLILVQMCGVMLFLPAMMAGTLAREKENQSVVLLLLTDMRPIEILWQKYLSHLMPMIHLILLSLPLLGICYAFGGVDDGRLLSGTVSVVLLCLQVGALSLFCSALSSTMAGALVSSYLLAILLNVGLPNVLVLLGSGPWGPAFCLPVYALDLPSSQGLLVRSLPPLVPTIIFLYLAWSFFVRRALAPPRHRLLAFFRWLERTLDRVNDAFGGVRLRRSTANVPDEHPVAWLEASKKLLGHRLFVGVLTLLLEVPIVVIALGVLTSASPLGWYDALTGCQVVYWALAALSMGVLSAGAIATERSRQTLQLLLTTPLPTREIILDKLRGVRRLIVVFGISLGTIQFFKAYCLDALPAFDGYVRVLSPWRPHVPEFYLASSLAAVAIFLLLTCWLAAFIALRARTRSGAIIAILVVFVVWNVLPYFVLDLCPPPDAPWGAAPWGARTQLDYVRSTRLWLNLHWLTPGSAIALLETGIPPLPGKGIIIWLGVSLFAHGHLALILRAICLHRADKWLGRWSRRRRTHAEHAFEWEA